MTLRDGLWVDALGWIGTAVCLGDYLLSSMGVYPRGSFLEQFCNLLGAVCMLGFGLMRRQRQVVILNLAWFLIACVALARLR